MSFEAKTDIEAVAGDARSAAELSCKRRQVKHKIRDLQRVNDSIAHANFVSFSPQGLVLDSDWFRTIS